MKGFDESLSTARAEQRPLLMGVLNLTPDSFFDGGEYTAPARAREQVEALIHAGADIIDIGAESSRPGAPLVSPGEQLRRIGETIEYASARGVLVSIDTTSPEVAETALRRGAQVVNDVSCLRDAALARAAAAGGGKLVLTHSRGPMTSMPGFSQWPDDDYPDIVNDVALDWERARQRAADVGLNAAQIIFDPGLGFSKNARQSFVLLEQLDQFQRLNAPILVGPGRKSFISAADPSPASERLGGTIAASLWAAQRGADILRVHDVADVRQALRVWSACEAPSRLREAEPPKDASRVE